MKNYPFHIIDPKRNDTPDSDLLGRRSCVRDPMTPEQNAARYVPSESLVTAMNVAIAAGEPLLITGEPGTGKTMAAYYAAKKLGLGAVLRYQAKSDSMAQDLLYDFDAVRYFFDANSGGRQALDRSNYVDLRGLGEAVGAKKTRVVLIDEIDKAPRAFATGLLRELDEMAFVIKETDEEITANPDCRPIVFITSNEERDLPDAFLRRCVYHHLELDQGLLERIVTAHRASFEKLSDGFVSLALERFASLRKSGLVKSPATGELLIWLRVLDAAFRAGQVKRIDLEREVGELPFLALLIKRREDFELLPGNPPTH